MSFMRKASLEFCQASKAKLSICRNVFLSWHSHRTQKRSMVQIISEDKAITIGFLRTATEGLMA